MTVSVRALQACAAGHFADYTCNRPVGNRPTRAFAAYDRQGDPTQLTPTDCLAPNLLSMRLGFAEVVPMFQLRDAGAGAPPHAELLEAMQGVLDDPRSSTDRFVSLDLEDPHGVWSVVRHAMAASENVPGLTAVAVSKILHRKRPELVPIYDSKVFEFYLGKRPSGKSAPSRFWPAIQADIRDNEEWLLELADSVRTADGRKVSPLRVADIVIWEHQVTGCDTAVT